MDFVASDLSSSLFDLLKVRLYLSAYGETDGTQERCLQLKGLILRRPLFENSPQCLSPANFSDFLHSAKNLSDLELSFNQKPWSCDLFLAITQKPGIRKLGFREEWLYKLSVATYRPFQALRALEIELCDHQLDLLAPYLGILTSLRLGIHGSSAEVWKAICCLPCLQILEVHYLGDSADIWLSGKDLVELARRCQALCSVCIGDKKGRPRADDASKVSDEVLIDFVQKLSELRRLELRLYDSALTHNSILHLGTNCKNLARLVLTVHSVNFRKLARFSFPRMFPKITYLKLEQEHRPKFSISDPIEATKLGRKFLKMMPKIGYFQSGLESERHGFLCPEPRWVEHLNREVERLLVKAGRFLPRLEFEPYTHLFTNPDEEFTTCREY